MRRRRKAREGQEKRKRKNKRPILKKLCAALLRSFRDKHSEKMKGSARGNWDPWEGQQPFRPNPNGVGDRTNTLRRPLIGAVFFASLARLNWVYDVLIYLVRLTQIFATADHNIKMFSKIATFLSLKNSDL